MLCIVFPQCSGTSPNVMRVWSDEEMNQPRLVQLRNYIYPDRIALNLIYRQGFDDKVFHIFAVCECLLLQMSKVHQ